MCGVAESYQVAVETYVDTKVTYRGTLHGGDLRGTLLCSDLLGLRGRDSEVLL